MVRKMAYVGFSYLAGLFFASFLNAFAAFALAVAAVFISAIVLILYKNAKLKICVCVISCACGLILYSAHNVFVYRNIIKYDGYDIILQGKIVSFADYSNDKALYTLKGVINDDITAEVTCFADSTDCHIGDYITVMGTAQAFENTYEFASENYYNSKGIFLSVADVKGFILTENNSFSVLRYIQKYRDYLCDVISGYLPEEESSVLIAMVFGDKSGVSDVTKAMMYRAGIGHIMAVSGVNLAVVSVAVIALLKIFKLNKYVRFLAITLFVTAFVLLAGTSMSVLRSAVMIAIVYGADLFKRRNDVLNSLGISIIVLTVSSPYAVRDASFLLSVGGVFGVGVLAPVIIKAIEQKIILGNIAKSFISSVAAVVVIFPISMLFFDEVSIVSPITNIILMPVCTVVMILGIIIAMTGGIGFIAVPLLSVSGICCKIIIYVSELVGRKTWAYVPLGYNFTKYFILIALIFIVAVIIKTKSIKLTSYISVLVTALCIVTVCIYRNNSEYNLAVAVIGDGKSSAMIIHNYQTACIIDLHGGGKTSASVCKYLNRVGINKIDSVILGVDSTTSQAIYMNDLKLFDVDSVLVPDGDYMLNNTAAFGEVTLKYNKQNGLIQMNNYNIEITDNNSILIRYDDRTLLAVNGKEEYDGIIDNCEVFINYYGTAPQDIDSDVYIAMDEDSAVLTNKDRAVFIGENVETVFYSNGTIKSEEIINGIGQ